MRSIDHTPFLPFAKKACLLSDILDYLKTRRSVAIPSLVSPAPEAQDLEDILTVAARVPDHGKLAPWRFVLIRGEGAALIGRRLADLVESREGPLSETRRRAEETRFTRAPLVVAVVSTAAEHVKIPVWEQQLSAGAVCMNLIHAAYAKGFGANWVTEWVAYDAEAKAILSIGEGEAVAGFVHLGRPSETLSDRPRPALADVVCEIGADGQVRKAAL